MDYSLLHIYFEVMRRFLADSNRRTRFCRPLTKPLIQGTLLLSIFVSRLRLQRYDIFFNLQIFCYFFLTFLHFFRNRTLACCA